MAEQATVDQTGTVTVRLSRVVELMEDVEQTDVVREFIGISGRVLLSEGDPKFEFYSRLITPQLRGIVPMLFFRESMGEFFLGIVDSASRRAAAEITDGEAEFLQSMFGAGCDPSMALDNVFLLIEELDFSPGAAVGLKPISIVTLVKEDITEECLDAVIPVPTALALLESCRSMLEDAECLNAVIDELSRTPDLDTTLRNLIDRLKTAYNDPDAVSMSDIFTVRERIIELLPFFAVYPPGSDHTALFDIHFETAATEFGGGCDSVRIALPDCPPDATAPLPCPVPEGETVCPPVGSRIQTLDTVTHEHPRWPLEVPAGVSGRVTHIDDNGVPRIRWESFEFPFDGSRRGYEVWSFPLDLSQCDRLIILDNAFFIRPDLLEACGIPNSVSECVKEVARCLLEKFRCLTFESDLDMCPLPFRITHRICVSCGLRLDLHGFEFAAAVVAELDRLISGSEGMVRKITEKFTEDLAKAKLGGTLFRFARSWRGFRLADRITVQGGLLCAEWSVTPVHRPDKVPSPECREAVPCAFEISEFPGKDELLAVLAGPGPDSDDALVFVGELAADILEQICCSCAAFRLEPIEGGGRLRFSWELPSSYDLSPFGIEFAARVGEVVRDMLVCEPSKARKLLETARDGIGVVRTVVGRPQGLDDALDAFCSDTEAPSPEPVVKFLGPWMDPDLIDSRRSVLDRLEDNAQIIGLEVQPDAGGGNRTLVAITVRARDGRVPSGSDLVFRLENIDTGDRAEGFLRVGESENLEGAALRFAPRHRMSGIVFQQDSGLTAANVDMEMLFEEEGGGRFSLEFFIASPIADQHFVGQPQSRARTLTTVCVETDVPVLAAMPIRIQNLDTGAFADMIIGSGQSSATRALSIPFAEDERLSARIISVDPTETAVLTLTALSRVEELVVEQLTVRTLLRIAQTEGAVLDGQRVIGSDFQVVRISDGEVVQGGFRTIEEAQSWLAANFQNLTPPDPGEFEAQAGSGGEAVGTAQTMRRLTIAATPTPVGRDIIASVSNLTTLVSQAATLPVGRDSVSVDMEVPFAAGELLAVDIEQADDGTVVQQVSAAMPRGTLRLYDEDSPSAGSTVVEATATLDRPSFGMSMLIRFENIDNGDREDFAVSSGESSATATVGLVLPPGDRLRVSVCRTGAGASGLELEWRRQFPPTESVTVEVLSEIAPPTAGADVESCGLLDDLDEFVRAQCASAPEPDDFVLNLGRTFDWPFARRLAVPELSVWEVLKPENLVGIDDNLLLYSVAFAHDDLTPEFLALLRSPECPVEPGVVEPCPLEILLLEGRTDEVVETVAAALADSLKSLRFELRNLGDDSGIGLIVCVRTDLEICFKDDSATIDLILDRFASLLTTERRDALRKAVEHVNDLREKIRIPSPSDPLNGLTAAANRLTDPRLSESYLLTALLSRDPLLTDDENSRTGFVFFGGGRAAAPGALP